MSKKPAIPVANLEHYPAGDLPDPAEHKLETISSKTHLERDEFDLLRRVRDRKSRKRLWAKGRADEPERTHSLTALEKPVLVRLDFYEVQGWKQSHKQSLKGRTNRPSAMFDEVLIELIRGNPTERDSSFFWESLCGGKTFWSGSNCIEISQWHLEGK